MKIAIIGGGISGMSAAHWLSSTYCDIHLFEREDQLGGRIGIKSVDNKSYLLGGKNIGDSYVHLKSMLSDYGMTEFEDFSINVSREIDGKLVTIKQEDGIEGFKKFAEGAPNEDFQRLLKWMHIVKSSPDNRWLSSEYFNRLAETENGTDIAAMFSPIFAERMLRPIVTRMNGAEPDEAYLCNFGSNLGLAVEKIQQISGGFEEFIRRFENKHTIHKSTTVTALEINADNTYSVCFEDSQGEMTEDLFDCVVLAVTADIAAGLTKSLAPALCDLLAGVKYYPVCTLVAQYRSDVFKPDLRGIVFDSQSALSNAAAYSRERIDTVRYTFSGRSARPFLAADPDEKSLLAYAEEKLGHHLDLSDNQIVRSVSCNFKPGMCAYTQDYMSFKTGVDQELASYPNLYLCGDYIEGASLEACVFSAKCIADKFMNRPKSA